MEPSRLAPASPGHAAVPTGHLRWLDGVRALAALFVLWHHASLYPNASGRSGGSPLLDKILTVFFLGRGAVDLFIVLSGFCLMLPVLRGQDGRLRDGAGAFFRRRAWRILPPYFGAMALSAALIAWAGLGERTGTVWDQSLPVTFAGVASHLFLVHDFARTTLTQMDYPLWSVAVEWRIYFAFPLLLALRRWWGPWSAALVALIAGYALAGLLAPVTAEGLTAQYLGLFALGMLAAEVACGPGASRFNGWAVRGTLWAAAFGLMVAIYLVFHAHTRQGTFPPNLIFDLLAGTLSAVCLTLVGGAPSGRRGLGRLLRRAFGWGPIAFVGTFAYSVYLIHAPLLQLVWLHGGQRWAREWPPHASFALLGGVATVVVLLVSYGFYLVCERPFLRVGKGFRTPAVAATLMLGSSGTTPASGIPL